MQLSYQAGNHWTREKVDKIKERCKDKCSQIIAYLCPDLDKAILNAPHHTHCPVHGGKNGDAFRVFNDFEDTGGTVCNTCGVNSDIIATVTWANDWGFSYAIWGIEWCLDNFDQLPKIDFTQQTFTNIPHDEKYRAITIEKIIGELLPLDHSDSFPARKYLERRGIDLSSSAYPISLFFHRALTYWRPGHCSIYPAIIGIITDLDDKIVGIHRTYITPEGDKAPVDAPKKMLSIHKGATSGGAIKLYQPTDKLAVAEGIETALAVNIGTDLPVWATGSAVGMKHVNIPETVKEVSIWFDLDQSCTGERAARFLANRFLCKGIKLKLMKPPGPIPDGMQGIDWLDILTKE